MHKLLLASAALALAAAPAFAGTTSTSATGAGMSQSGTSNSGASNAQMAGEADGALGGTTGPALQKRIHAELSKAGFTDIHVMPQSFLVRAKDSGGNPVMMVINPDSVTAVTQMAGNSGSMQNGGGASSGTNDAQNSGSGAMGSSTMKDSAHAGSAINAPNGNGTTVQ